MLEFEIDMIKLIHSEPGIYRGFNNGKFIFEGAVPRNRNSKKYIDAGYVEERYDQYEAMHYYKKECGEQVFDKISISCYVEFSSEEIDEYGLGVDFCEVDLIYDIPESLRTKLINMVRKVKYESQLSIDNSLFDDVEEYFSDVILNDTTKTCIDKYGNMNTRPVISDEALKQLTKLEKAVCAKFGKDSESILISYTNGKYKDAYGYIQNDDSMYYSVEDSKGEEHSDRINEMYIEKKGKFEIELKRDAKKLFKEIGKCIEFPYRELEVRWKNQRVGVKVEYRHELYGHYNSKELNEHIVMKAGKKLG